ncbi:MAG: dephospho-CoA kinase [Actinomycetota bacterium]|nr:dephospho-CoA kinase [Actinomycetota bacterium]
MTEEAPVQVLLAGGIGSGKSAVGELLEERGARVIDADRVGHQVLESDRDVAQAVAQRWPGTVHDGQVDRPALAGMVFSHPDELRALEQLTHPPIRRRLLGLVKEAREPIVVVEVPLLDDFMGQGWRRVVVDAPASVRAARLRARGMSAGDIERRMAVQPERRAWLEAADYVVDNSGDQEDLEREVDRLWSWLLAFSAGGR